jgi:hypothetical protein
VLAWISFYIGMLVGALLVVGVMGFIFYKKDTER